MTEWHGEFRRDQALRAATTALAEARTARSQALRRVMIARPVKVALARAALIKATCAVLSAEARLARLEGARE